MECTDLFEQAERHFIRYISEVLLYLISLIYTMNLALKLLDKVC